MKIKTFFSILFLCFALISCGADEEEGAGGACVTVMDCPSGYSCINATCQPQIADTDTEDSTDTDSNSDTTDSGTGLPGDDYDGNDSDDDSDDADNDITGEDSDDVSSTDEDTAQETPDEPVVLECPNNCSGHGNCDTTTGICACTDNHDGEDCSGCLTGYSNNSGTCVKKQCNPNCKTITSCYFYDDSENSFYPYGAETEAHGTCNDSTGGDCVCDQGWITNGTGETIACGASLSVLNNVECSVCDKNNPPAKYIETGCPTDWPTIMGTLMFCDVFMGMMGTGYPMGVGKCYYEPGTLRLYCKCEPGYTMSGSKYYDENSIGACAAESSE